MWWLAGIALIVGILVAARPWLIRRGFLFPPGERGSVSRAVLSVGVVLQPEFEHILEVEQSIGLADEASGAPPVPT